MTATDDIYRGDTADPLDGFCRHAIATVATQHGIIAFIRKAAEVMAEAGVASHKATGDDPAYAIAKWTQILRDEAVRLARERREPAAAKKVAKQS